METTKKCPKCGFELERGKPLKVQFQPANYIALDKKDNNWFTSDSLIPFVCKSCGYVELYDSLYVPIR